MQKSEFRVVSEDSDEVSGLVVRLEERSQDLFVLTVVPRPPHGPVDLAHALQGGALKWRDLDIEDPALRLRVAFLDKMRPVPRVELDIVDAPDETKEEEGEANGAGAVDSDYYDSYADLGTHELMLRDGPRMKAYHDAIMKNSEAIRGKVVLDVGCGTGVLSMFAAKAGAKVVYAVEASNMAAHAANLVQHNGLSDVVTVMHGRMEDVELPGKVDVIISEWMGFYLLHESMLNSVLDARDRWLAEGGLMLPSHATIYACPVSMDQYRQETEGFWSDVCGLDLSPFGAAVKETAPAPLVKCLGSDQLLAEPAVVASFDCGAVKAAELVSLQRDLCFTIRKAGNLAGVALWFDCRFDVRSSAASSTPSSRKRSRESTDTSAQVVAHGRGAGGEGSGGGKGGVEGVAGGKCVVAGGKCVVLSTSPECQDTHWKQTVVMLGVYAPVVMCEKMEVGVAMAQDTSNPRRYAISIST